MPETAEKPHFTIRLTKTFAHCSTFQRESSPFNNVQSDNTCEALPLSVAIHTVYLNILAREQDLHINDRMHVRFLKYNSGML